MSDVIGNIVEDGKLFSPVYIMTGDASSSGNEGEANNKVLGSSIAMCGSFYSSTFYGLIAGPGGQLSSVTWDRTSDPVVKQLGVVIPSTTTNPQSFGFIVNIQSTGNNASNSCNNIYISEIEGEELKEGTLFLPNQNFRVSQQTSGAQETYISGFYGGYYQVYNNTSKNLNVSLSGIYKEIFEKPASASCNFSIGSTVNASSNSNKLSFGGNAAYGNIADLPYDITCTITFA